MQNKISKWEIGAGLLVFFMFVFFFQELAWSGTVVAWGYDGAGQTSVPGGLTNAITIAGGAYHSVALESNGTVVAWGDNTFGQTNVPAGLTNVSAIACGWYHNLALKNNGTIVAWGDNTYGQTTIPASATNVAAVGGGWLHSLALMSNGTVIAWGDNGWGQSSVPAGLTNVMAIAAGELHSLALKSNGTVVAWGNNYYNQANVPSGLTNVTAIAAGWLHSVVVESNSTVVAWGDNTFGQTNVPSTWLKGQNTIVAGAGYNLSLQSTVILTGSGDNTYGQTNIPQGLGSVVMQIGAGGYHCLTIATGSPPVVVTQPTNQTAYINSTATFSSTATGTPPIGYQWQFDGVNVACGTNSSLTLTNVQSSNAGNYILLVTNLFGSAVSSNATLTVPPFLFATGQTNLQMTAAGFKFQVEGAGGSGIVLIEASTNFTDWTPILTNPPASAPVQFLDSSATNFPVRFYRAQEE